MDLELSEEFFNELHWLVREGGYRFFLEPKQGRYSEPRTEEDLKEYMTKYLVDVCLMLNHK